MKRKLVSTIVMALLISITIFGAIDSISKSNTFGNSSKDFIYFFRNIAVSAVN